MGARKMQTVKQYQESLVHKTKVAKFIHYLFNRLHLLLLSLLLLGYFEFLCRESVTTTIQWMLNNPLQFALNELLVFSLLLLFVAISGRTWAGYTVLSTLLTVIGFISGIKMEYLGVPLLPWDVVLSKETQSMAAYLKGMLNVHLLGYSFLFFIISFVMLKFVPKFSGAYRSHERAAFVVIAVFIGFCTYSDIPLDLKHSFQVHDYFWDEAANYKTNGYLVTTALTTKLVFIPVPEQYNQANMKTILQQVNRRTNIDPAIKPNIIVILSEALWDPTLLPKVTFDHDPLPNLHELMKNYSSGWMLSTVFGGGTANVEFEILTGNSMRFMPEGSVPYIQYVNHGVDSLASILRRQGYAATAINPYHNWFYNSKKAYQNFGFSNFISMEFFDSNLKGFNIADSEVSKNIILQSERTAGADFIFANTMENHFPFDPGKFKTNTFTVSGDVSAATKGLLETYATGIADSDLMLKSLVDYYTQSKEPTIVAFFGDHKPILGSNFGVYTDTGYLKPNQPDRLRRLYDVPLLVWNNYLPKQKDNLDISPAFLEPYLLNLAQKQGTPYTDMLYALSQKSPILPPASYYSGFNIKAADLVPYKLMQYDMLFGKQYQMQAVKEPIVDPNFLLGSGPMIVDSVSPSSIKAGVAFQQEQNDSTLVLSGQRFVQECAVYWNGKKLVTKLEPDGKLRAWVPKQLYNKAGKIELQVLNKDSEHIVVSETKKFEIDVKAF
jgi:phosphoglycerol transferase MdoB-like AlkP superfamily enzyme